MGNDVAALLDDVRARLAKARLSLDLCRDLLERAESEFTTASDKIAAVAILVREIAAKAKGAPT